MAAPATPAKNTICLWYNGDAEEAARFYASVFPDSKLKAVHRAPSDYSVGKQGDVLTVEFIVLGIACLGINGGQASECGWCKDKWGISWQITPIALTQGYTDPDPAVAKRVFEAMMKMGKIDVAAIEAARLNA